MQDQWEATTRLLEEAREAMIFYAPTDRGYLDLYSEFIENNELGFALDVLTDFAQEKGYGEDIRVKLAAAAAGAISTLAINHGCHPERSEGSR